MLKIETSESDFGKILKIINNNNSFKILLGGNGDLYFSPNVGGMQLLKSKDPICFNIAKDAGFFYESFDRLYNKICAYDPFDYDENVFFKSKVEEQEYQKRKDYFRPYPLVHNKVISWHSDEDCWDDSSILNISKEKNDSLKLEFIKNKVEDELYFTYSIRFRNSGSNYDPFNLRFMELYSDLCNYYFSISNMQTEKSRILKK